MTNSPSASADRLAIANGLAARKGERLILHTISRGAAFAFRLSPMIKIEMCELQCLAIGVRSPLLVPTRGTTTRFAACSDES